MSHNLTARSMQLLSFRGSSLLLLLTRLVPTSVAVAQFPRVGDHDAGTDLLLGAPSFNSEEVLYGTSISLRDQQHYAYGSTASDAVGRVKLRLLVGAPMHDYTTSVPSINATQDNSGGVFLYELPEEEGKDDRISSASAKWREIWFLAGDHAGEKIGQRLSMSHDGSIVAVRRQNDAASYVQVYNITDSDHPVMLGDAVACQEDTRGNTVSLSPNGKRLALSCEYANGNTGGVEIFDYNHNEWSFIGSLQGYSRGNFFGWSTAFSHNGNRLAISAPNYDRNSETRVGLVQVYEYTQVEWVQVGMDILGLNQGDQFGFAMDLNSYDGTVLVASSPGGDAEHGLQVGTVHVLVEHEGEWVPKGQALEGRDFNNRFGRAVSISDDGNRMAASSYIHDSSRGHVRVFDFDVNASTNAGWTQFGDDIDGENTRERFGSGLESVSLLGDGSLLASGSTYYGQGGRVRVFDMSGTPVSSGTPLTPTTAPIATSGSSNPSPEPGTTSAAVTATPTEPPKHIEDLGNGDGTGWDIELDTVTVQFDALSVHKEIELVYTTSDRNTFVQVFQDDCQTVVEESVVRINEATLPLTEESPLINTLVVQLDILPQKLGESPIFTRLDLETGTINLCVRVDLMDDQNLESVRFIRRKVEVNLDMARNFHVQNLLVAPDEIAVHVDASLEYRIHACHCDARSLECHQDVPVETNSEVIICLNVADQEHLEVGEIHRLDFSRGPVSHSAVLEGVADDFTNVVTVGSTTIVQSRLLSKFFETNSTENVLVTGSCALSFKRQDDDASRRRFLTTIDSRSLREVSRDFFIKLQLLSEAPPSNALLASWSRRRLLLIVASLMAWFSGNM